MRRLPVLALALIPSIAAAQVKVSAPTPEAAGEYLMIVGSCHDCHTAKWTELKGKVAKDDQLTGSAIGFKGPWGTVYSKNLRTIAARQSEDHWVDVLKTADGGDGKLPMPWHNTALMSDDDLRALYKYTKSLGAKTGERIPRNLKPGVEPTSGEWVDLTTKGSPAPAGAASPAPTKPPK
jgi:cytochrome c553